MIKRFWISAVSLLCVVILYIAIQGGVFRRIQSNFSGTCTPIFGIQGSEDMAIIGDHFLIVSSNPSLGRHDDLNDQGHLYLLDISSEKPQPRSLTDGLGLDFHPHGLGVFKLTTNSWRIFVVNHRSAFDTIEIFDFDSESQKLRLHQTIEDAPLLMNANDIQPLSENTFIITHDHGGRTDLAKLLEDFTKHGKGYLTFYDGMHLKKIWEDLSFANGIAWAKNSDDLYVASMLGQKIIHFKWKESHLEKIREISLDAAPDNLTYDPESRDLWVGAHPKLLALKLHSKNPTRLSPSMILKINDIDSHPEIQKIFTDDGTSISAASVAVTQGNRLYIGAIYDNKILSCKF